MSAARVTPDAYTRRYLMTMSDDTVSGVFDGDTVARLRAAWYGFNPSGDLWARVGAGQS